jgi:hypothetical protein
MGPAGNYRGIIFSDAPLEAPPGSWDAPGQPHMAPSHFFRSLDARRMDPAGNYSNIIFYESPLAASPGSWDAPASNGSSHVFRSLDEKDGSVRK